jgi:hypothetical protein
MYDYYSAPHPRKKLFARTKIILTTNLLFPFWRSWRKALQTKRKKTLL